MRSLINYAEGCDIKPKTAQQKQIMEAEINRQNN